MALHGQMTVPVNTSKSPLKRWSPALWLLWLMPACAADVDFLHDIVPVLRQHCAECHTGDKKKGGLSMNTRESLLKGGESGAVLVPGDSRKSRLLTALGSTDPDTQMPPKGARVPADKIELIKRWIDSGAAWMEGFAFRKPAYEPPLHPRRPDLPRVVSGRTNAIDRILDAHIAKQKLKRTAPLDDATFARRLHLDLHGLLPEPAALEKFLADKRPDRRAILVRELLANDVAYAEHWLTFWNDLLRNDYGGTGFITGGRKQISKWLYRALVDNLPYDQFARELLAPGPETEGFTAGIKWRGDVSAGQTVEIQFAQSVGQTFLGINLKCASCHDSFIDRWKLEEAYGLAAIYSAKPLTIHRCDKPLGTTASAAWLFPELGKIDPDKPQPERLKQLAALMTQPENGRFSRTVVNRLWHRLMGRGIVHPTDAMQTEPWNADLLDQLAVHLADSRFDIKKVLELIATSHAYQSVAQVVARDADDRGYVYAGPRAKRLTAEQFVDTVWQLTGTAPARFDAPVLRGKADAELLRSLQLAGKWVWSRADASNAAPGETITLRRKFNLRAAPVRAGASISVDNSYTLFVNGQNAGSGDQWDQPDGVSFANRLRAGANEILLVAKNGGNAPNPAAAFFEARLTFADGASETIATDESWDCTKSQPDARGKFKAEPDDFKPVVEVAGGWGQRVGGPLKSMLAQAALTDLPMVRAGLLKSDFLMRTLGRPNRDQIVSVRPNELSTLEAIDLANGEVLAGTLERGAKSLLARHWDSPDALPRWLYTFALSRKPTADELKLVRAALGPKPTEQDVADLLWSLVMLPEFSLVR